MAALVAGCGTAPHVTVPPAVTLHANLVYCHGQMLDLYVPDGSPRPRPVAMYVHGGGMTAGSKDYLNQVFLDTLVRAGFAVAAINYRLAPQFEFPAQIEDVTCAIRYLRAESVFLGLDRHRLYAFGTTVGGEMVALAALTARHSPFDAGAYARQSGSLTAAVDLFGPTNLGQASSGFTTGDLQRVFGSDNPRGPALASPIHYVAPGAPPILIVQGSEDTTVRPSQSIELYDSLKSARDPAQLILIRNMGHMFAHVGTAPIMPSIEQIASDVVRFFDGNRRGDHGRAAHRRIDRVAVRG